MHALHLLSHLDPSMIPIDMHIGVVLLPISLLPSSILLPPSDQSKETSKFNIVLINYLLHPFHNVSYSIISHTHIDVNESKHIYLSRFININMNVENARMTYIVKRGK